jgi:hypothetical protein
MYSVSPCHSALWLPVGRIILTTQRPAAIDRNELFTWLWLLFLLCLLGSWYYNKARHLLLEHSSRKWPSARAIIERRSIGPVSIGKGALNGCFLGYSFSVAGARYAGFFVVFCSEDEAARMQKELPGSPVNVRYKISDPNVSFLLDRQDSRFGWQGAGQDPEYLNQAPASELAETLKN